MNDDKNPNKRRSGEYTRNCIICGEVFHTNSKTRQLCYIPHTRECCICGNAFPAGETNYDRPWFCSGFNAGVIREVHEIVL